MAARRGAGRADLEKQETLSREKQTNRKGENKVKVTLQNTEKRKEREGETGRDGKGGGGRESVNLKRMQTYKGAKREKAWGVSKREKHRQDL